jgi:SAM-dependent methyltransferase
MRKLDPVFRERLRESEHWDDQFGTDTGGQIPKTELNFPEDLAAWCNWYEPAPPWIIREFFTKLPADVSDFHWVDLGSGKGRVVLMCAMFPLRAVTGVELSRTLHRIAVHNLELFPKNVRRTEVVQFVEGNAETFDLPEVPLIISLFNSFGPPILTTVLERLIASLRDHPREAYFIYINPVHRSLIEGTGVFDTLVESGRYRLYRYRAPTER